MKENQIFVWGFPRKPFFGTVQPMDSKSCGSRPLYRRPHSRLTTTEEMTTGIKKMFRYMLSPFAPLASSRAMNMEKGSCTKMDSAAYSRELTTASGKGLRLPGVNMAI